MESLRFSWDNRKNKANQKKHGISFDVAKTVFFDEKAVEFIDPDHSELLSRQQTTFLLYAIMIIRWP